ncbi:MAG: MGMT family protein [Phycisphaerales bacterium]|nr:MGMT family protein [Phycisphaerales bacterium]
MRRGSKPTCHDLSPPRDAHLRILAVIRDIPAGRVCTYGRVAEGAGLPGRARLVGRILRDSPLSFDVPWHRVVNASGRISERSGSGMKDQRHLLTAEGILFMTEDRIDLAEYLWEP